MAIIQDYHCIPQRIWHELLGPYSVEIGPLQAGGLSGANVWRGESNQGLVAVRCWPAEHPTPDRLARIHAALSTARKMGHNCIPNIFANRTGGTFTTDGRRLWELTQWMPGVADYHQFPTDERLKSALRALASLHQTWAQASSTVVAAASPTVTQRRAKLQEWLIRLPELWCHPVCRAVQQQPIADLAQRTLRQLAERGPAELQALARLQVQPVNLHFVLRDIWSDHVLFTQDQVTGIIDFGAARVDEPATDVARLLGSLEPLNANRWQLGWEAYQQLNPIVDHERVVILDRVANLLSTLQWFEWLVLESRSFQVQQEELCARWQRLLVRSELWQSTDIGEQVPVDRNENLER